MLLGVSLAGGPLSLARHLWTQACLPISWCPAFTVLHVALGSVRPTGFPQGISPNEPGFPCDRGVRRSPRNRLCGPVACSTVRRAAPTSLILPCHVQACERSSCPCRVSIPDDYQGQLFATIRQTDARGTPRTPALSWRTANKKTAFSKVNLPFFGLLASLALSIRFHRNPQSRSIR